MGSEGVNFSSLRPFLDGSDYPHWKFKMELYLDSDPIKLQEVVLNGWEHPKATLDNVEILIDRTQWTQDQNEANYKNKKVMTILLASMPREGGKGQHCQFVKEVW